MHLRSPSVLIAAVGVLALGPLVLGLDWRGHEVSPGVWRDGVALWRWALLDGGLLLAGVVLARWLPSAGSRLFVVGPLLAWCGWMLRASTLGPLAWLIYAVPLLLAWFGGTVIGDAVRRRSHTP